MTTVSTKHIPMAQREVDTKNNRAAALPSRAKGLDPAKSSVVLGYENLSHNPLESKASSSYAPGSTLEKIALPDSAIESSKEKLDKERSSLMLSTNHQSFSNDVLDPQVLIDRQLAAASGSKDKTSSSTSPTKNHKNSPQKQTYVNSRQQPHVLYMKEKHFELGHDKHEIVSTSRQDFVKPTSEVLVNNKLNLHTGGASSTQSNLFRSEKDVDEWKQKHLNTLTRIDFQDRDGAKHAMQPEERASLRQENRAAHFVLGEDQNDYVTTQQADYVDQKGKKAERTGEDPRKSSIVLGEIPQEEWSKTHMKTTKATDFTGHKDQVRDAAAEKERIKESRKKLVSSSVVLGSDENDMRSLYAVDMRQVVYK